MNVDSLIMDIIEQQKSNKQVFMKHYKELLDECNGHELDGVMDEMIAHLCHANYRQEFYEEKIHVELFDLCMRNNVPQSVSEKCIKVLHSIFEESPTNAEPVINRVIKYLHKPRYTQNIQFYITLAQIVSTAPAAQTLLSSQFLPFFVKFYRYFVEELGFNFQLTNSFGFEQYQHDYTTEEVEKSEDSQISSLSLDEDRVPVSKAVRAAEALSTRSMLSEFGKTLYADEQNIQPGKEGDAVGLEDSCFGDSEIDRFSSSGGDARNFAEHEQCDSPATMRAAKRQDILAENGPMTLYSPAVARRPSFVPRLDLSCLQHMDYRHNDDTDAGPMAPQECIGIINGLRAKSDQVFQNRVNEIIDAKKGQVLLHEVGQLVGQFIAMSDYPSIASRQSGRCGAEIAPKSELDERNTFYTMAFGDGGKRDFDYSNFDFAEVIAHQGLISRQQPADITRIGFFYLFHAVTLLSQNFCVEYARSLIPSIVLDLAYLRSRKAGVLPASVFAPLAYLKLILSIDIPIANDVWGSFLETMYAYADTPFRFFDEVSHKYITEETSQMKVVERRTLCLHAQCNLLTRLEGARRASVSCLSLIANKLATFCKFYRNLSAAEDLSVCLGVLVDVLTVSRDICFIRAATVEMCLPVLLKLLELIIERKIRSRQYYIFISHRLLQVFNELLSSGLNVNDYQENNINLLLIDLFVKQEISVNLWLKRYAYLILINSRVKDELSGLYINQQQCSDSFHQLRKTFFSYVQNLSKLIIEYFYMSSFNLSENAQLLANTNYDYLSFGEKANLQEQSYPLGRDDNFEINVNIDVLPLNMMLQGLVNNESLNELKSKTLFQRQHNFIPERAVPKNLDIGEIDCQYIIDYDIGVLMEFQFLNQESILSTDDNRDIYLSCVNSLEQFISIPGVIRRLEKRELNKFIIYHYLSFLKFYNTSIETLKKYDISNFTLASAHLAVLKKFAEADDERIRQHIYITKVIEFLVEQLVYETNGPVDAAYDSTCTEPAHTGTTDPRTSQGLEDTASADCSSISSDIPMVKAGVTAVGPGAKPEPGDAPPPILPEIAMHKLIVCNTAEPNTNNSAAQSTPISMLNMNCVESFSEMATADLQRHNPVSSLQFGDKNVIEQPHAECVAHTTSTDEELKTTSESSEDLSDIPPLREPVQARPGIVMALDLGAVEEKRLDGTVVSHSQPYVVRDNPPAQTKVVDQNIKMHLVEGQESSGRERDHSHGVVPSMPAVPIYYDDQLHETLILFILQLIVRPATETFDINYVSEFPHNMGMTNILYILHQHLNSHRNRNITLQILERKLPQAERRLMRLLCYQAFHTEFYNLERFTLVARGAFGAVYTGNVDLVHAKGLEPCATPVAIKLQPLSSSAGERCTLHDIYNEITVMERLQGLENFCQIYDYGVTPQGYIIVMQKYYTSFRNFRLQLFSPSPHTNNPSASPCYGHEESMMKYIRIFLFTYIMFLEELQIMHKQKVIHFDLKADNIFVNPATIEWLCMDHPPVLDGSGSFEANLLERFLKIYHQSELPYTITLADFGESHIFSSDEDKKTLLSKGTDFNKSPEMLASTNEQFNNRFGSRRSQGAGPSSDIWSAACTLYEMLTGDYLFYDNDWIRFFLRVTTINTYIEYGKDSFAFCDCPEAAECIRGLRLIPEKRAMLGNCEPLIDLLEFQLVEDPAARPNIQECIEMTKHVLNVYFPSKYDYDAYKQSGRRAFNLDILMPRCMFPESAWDFKVRGSPEEKTENIYDVITPECNINNSNTSIKGIRLSTIKHSEIPEPVDILNNGYVWLGTVQDLEDNNFINEHNIETIVDCTLESRSIQSNYVSRVFRPSNRLLQLFKVKPSRIKKSDFRDLIMALEQVSDVVRCTFALNGCILFVDETSHDIAANLTLFCIMEFEFMHLYQSAIHLKRLRPNANFNTNFLELLLLWHDNREKIGIKMLNLYPKIKLNSHVDLLDPEMYSFATVRVSESNYRCICGRTFFVIKPKSECEYIACNCVVSDEYKRTRNKQGEYIDCPITSCRTLQNYYLELFGLKLYKLLWVYIGEDDIVSNFRHTTQHAALIESLPNSNKTEFEFRTIDETRAPLYRIPIKDDWHINYCILCGAPTHCMRIRKERTEMAILATLSNR